MQPDRELVPTAAGCRTQRGDTDEPGPAPNMRGSLTLEADMKAGERLWLTGWTKVEPASGAEWISIVAESAGKGGRRR
jgi:hypothetical protein